YRRQWRRLAESGAVTLRRVVAGSGLEPAAADFLGLEASGWKGRRGTALADDPASRAFALSAISGAPPGAVAIDEIRLDGAPVAMLVGFRAGDLAVTWKIAHAEAQARYSPGVQVMIAASDAWLAEPGIARIDSLAAPDHPMVDGLWPERTEIGLVALGPVGGSALFSLGVRLAEAEAAARRTLREHRRKRAARAATEESTR
ncbi:MAG: GNAT family N-acetyltransferase, partial [Rhizobiales bacterium]|nr:GNAT family N-acetyltransferase [Hyphomicrobiales bacterium]